MWKHLVVGATVALFGLFAALEFSGPTTSSVRAPVGLSVSEAVAAGGVARRTARRTTRRVVRRTSVAGCAHRPPYYYCAGVYYRPVVENGVTVYVEVNP